MRVSRGVWVEIFGFQVGVWTRPSTRKKAASWVRFAALSPAGLEVGVDLRHRGGVVD